MEKNFATMRCMLSGDGENEPNADQVTQLAQEICKEDVISLLVHKLPILGWEVSNFRSTLSCFFKTDFSQWCSVFDADAEGFGALLVYIVEAEGRLGVLLPAIHRKSFGITRFSCGVVS